MSAGLVVDLHNTVDAPQLSVFQGSGANLIVGNPVDLLRADTNTQIWVAGGAGSGAVEVRVQTSDTLTSGDFVDPTSGLPQMPGNFQSGGAFFANSGLWASGVDSPYAPASGVLFQSGGIAFAQFQRPHRYARLIQVSSVFTAPVLAGFLAQKVKTGSGLGFSWSPGSGTTIQV